MNFPTEDQDLKIYTTDLEHGETFQITTAQHKPLGQATPHKQVLSAQALSVTSAMLGTLDQSRKLQLSLNRSSYK